MIADCVGIFFFDLGKAFRGPGVDYLRNDRCPRGAADKGMQELADVHEPISRQHAVNGRDETTEVAMISLGGVVTSESSGSAAKKSEGSRKAQAEGPGDDLIEEPSGRIGAKKKGLPVQADRTGRRRGRRDHRGGMISLDPQI